MGSSVTHICYRRIDAPYDVTIMTLTNDEDHAVKSLIVMLMTSFIRVGGDLESGSENQCLTNTDAS